MAPLRAAREWMLHSLSRRNARRTGTRRGAAQLRLQPQTRDSTNFKGKESLSYGVYEVATTIMTPFLQEAKNALTKAYLKTCAGQRQGSRRAFGTAPADLTSLDLRACKAAVAEFSGSLR